RRGKAADGRNTGGREDGPRMTRAIPEQIVAAVTALAESLASWCEEGRDGRSACPGCGRKVRPHQERSRQILTQCGAVTLERPWYTCGRCHRGWSVVETTLGVGS